MWLKAGRTTARAGWCRAQAESLRGALEQHAWDGQWYRRAYFDDGTPLGSAANDECQIDSIAQSWAVISAAANPARARESMTAVQQRLVRAADRAHTAARSAIRQGNLGARLYQGIRAGHSRERRAIHARFYLGRPGNALSWGKASGQWTSSGY